MISNSDAAEQAIAAERAQLSLIGYPQVDRARPLNQRVGLLPHTLKPPVTRRVRLAGAAAYCPVLGIWIAKRIDNSVDGPFAEHHRVNAGLLLLILVSFEIAGITLWLLSGACVVVLTMHTPERSSAALGPLHNYFRWIQYSGLALFALISLAGALAALLGRQLPMPQLARVKRKSDFRPRR